MAAYKSALQDTLNCFETQILQNLYQRTKEAKKIQVQLETMLMKSLKSKQQGTKKKTMQLSYGMTILPYKEIRYQGSAYEGLMVGGEECQPEFDLAVIIDMGPCQPIPDSKKSYECQLPFSGKMAEYTNRKDALLDNFHQNLRRSICEANKSGKFIEHFMLVNHKNSPAFEIDVYDRKPNLGGKLMYTFDMVPTLEVQTAKGPQHFFARQADEDELWTVDTAVMEKKALTNIDADGGCRKRSARILKALRDRDGGLRKMPSFVFKTLLLTEAQKAALDWSQDALAERVVGLLKSLLDALQSNTLPEVFEPKINVMDRIKDPYKSNVQGRIKNLLKERSKKKSLNNVIQKLL